MTLFYCIALHCIALHCIALHCIELYCIVLYCIALHCIALHCIALHCIVLHCIALYYIVLHCIALHCIVLYYIVLHCIALHCTYCIVYVFTIPDAQSCTSGVRLNEGTSTPSASTQFGGGRVEVCVGGRWLSPVRSSFTMSAAHVACFQEYGGSAFATAVVDGANL